MTGRLGVYGGMFDPVHNGHIAAARTAVAELGLDKLLLVPCANPNHRDPATADSRQRLQMLELAAADYRKLEVDDREIRRQGLSYSVDTLAELQESEDCEQLVFVLGMDSFNTLIQWHRWQSILSLCHLLVLGRQQSGPDADTARAIELDQRRVETADELFSREVGNILMFEDFNAAVSSTEVRSALRMNEDTSTMLDEKVQLYIEDNRLYR